MALTTDDLVKQLRERDQEWRERGGDMITYGPGDELSRLAAATIEANLKEIERLKNVIAQFQQSQTGNLSPYR